MKTLVIFCTLIMFLINVAFAQNNLDAGIRINGLYHGKFNSYIDDKPYATSDAGLKVNTLFLDIFVKSFIDSVYFRKAGFSLNKYSSERSGIQIQYIVNKTIKYHSITSYDGYAVNLGYGKNFIQTKYFELSGSIEPYFSLINNYTIHSEELQYDTLGNLTLKIITVGGQPNIYAGGLMLVTGIYSKIWKGFRLGLESGAVIFYSIQKGKTNTKYENYDGTGNLITTQEMNGSINIRGFAKQIINPSIVLFYRF